MAVNNPLFMVKAVLVGDSGVGKSYILSQVCTNEFSYQFKSSTWIETNNYHIKEDDGSTIVTQIWEIPSHESSQKQKNSYYRGTDIAVIVYDIMRKATFTNVEKWVKEVRDYTDENITIMLVGTKADRSHLRAVKTEEAKTYAEKENLFFMETSATDSLNLQNALKSLIIPIYHKRKATTMRQTVNHGGEDPGIVSLDGTSDQIVNQDLIMATGSFSEDDNPVIEIEPPILSSENFSIWKNRMIGFLNLIDDKLLETIKEGRHTPVKEQNKWSDEDKQKVPLDNKAMHILSMSLPDDIYRCVIYRESAKEMWDNIIVLFEGSEDTRECRRSLLIAEYNFFACKPGESLTNTYIRFKCIVNELRQYNKTFGNKEMLTKFIRSLPTEWSDVMNMLRETDTLKTMSLEVLYGCLLTYEREKKHDSWLKERVALQDAFSSQRGQLAGNNIR